MWSLIKRAALTLEEKLNDIIDRCVKDWVFRAYP